MFGMIIYLPLFMQGVLGVTATRSGNLLTPLMLGIVAGTFICGQATLRLRSYKIPSMAGSVLITGGTILFARMDGATRPVDVVLAMIAAGLGMGLLLPAYTVAVQNAAPQKHMGIATATSTFFRSIGSTVGVAIFGSILLTHYHHDFAKVVPPEYSEGCHCGILKSLCCCLNCIPNWKRHSVITKTVPIFSRRCTPMLDRPCSEESNGFS